jgi:hypothetical protein
MFVDDLLCRVLAGAATAADGQLALDLEKGARAAVDSLSDLPVGDRVTNADVHFGVSPLETGIPCNDPIQIRIIVNRIGINWT